MTELSVDVIKDAILNNLLASEIDINDFSSELKALSSKTGWKVSGHEHLSIFEEEGLESGAALINQMMIDVKESVRVDKFNLFNPIEELF